MKELVPYKLSYLGYGSYHYSPFIPTGKWRIVYSPYYDDPILELEHKGRLINSWIPEQKIEFRNKASIYENLSKAI